MSSTLTPNMSLIKPTVGSEPSPTWGTDLNTDMSILDQHNHTPGSGVQITPAAININTDLSFAGNFALSVAGITLSAQGSTPANNTIYESGVDLFYVDGLGNNIPITANGGIAGSPGSISNLTSPASASYVAVSKTFVWQSDTSIAANLDAASILLRNITPNSTNAITLQAPAALSTSYNVVLPTLPGTTSLMALDSSGNISAPYSIAGGLSGTVLADGTVTGAKLVNATVTGTKIAAATITGSNIAAQTVDQGNLSLRATGTTVAAGGVAISSGSGTFTTTSTTFVSVTNLTVTITTTGRPVMLLMSSAVTAGTGAEFGQVGIDPIELRFTRAGSSIALFRLEQQAGGSASPSIPPGAISTVDPVAAGTYTYVLQMRSPNSQTAKVINCNIIAYEL